MPLSPNLRLMQQTIEEYARGYGLDMFDIVYEMLGTNGINEFAAYGGFPTRYPHWRFGMGYDQLSKGTQYGGQKIYEMVINNDPCYAYLLSTNTLMDHKMVMAHVCAHCDFFKHNFYFSHTNRRMIDEIANHAARIRGYVDRFGAEKVEEFIDRVLSLENMLDLNVIFAGDDKLLQAARPLSEAEENAMGPVKPYKIAAPAYLDRFMNPPEQMEEHRKKLEKERQELRKRFPREPIRDILWFLLYYAPLDSWQKDIISIIREEAYYFAPQGMTKIMNEGWAAYWHSRLMTEKIMDDSDVVGFAERHASVVRASRAQLNPYRLGMMLFRDIAERWDKGKFGREWEDCDNMQERNSWDRKVGKGQEKIFEVRRVHNDVTFIDEFLTKEFVQDNMLFGYDYDKAKGAYTISTREYEEIKQKLLGSLVNNGNPYIHIQDANFENRSELLLVHQHYGTDLQADHARATLENLYHLWTRPTALVTKIEDKGVLLRFDGSDHSAAETDYDSWIGKKS